MKHPFLITGLLAMAAAVALGFLAQAPYPALEVGLGWGLAVASSVAARLLHRRAMASADFQSFAVWGVGANLGRVVVLVVIVVLAVELGGLRPMPFVLSTMVAYFLLLGGEIWLLRLAQSGGKGAK